MRVTSWRKAPLCLIGYDIRKYEQPMGKEYYVPIKQGFQMGNKVKTLDGIAVGPSHLQYNSPFGFLLTWPLCLHVWYQFKGQDTYVDGNGVTMTKPGTEKVLYWRCGARWDAHDGFYETPSWYGPGLHWD